MYLEALFYYCLNQILNNYLWQFHFLTQYITYSRHHLGSFHTALLWGLLVLCLQFSGNVLLMYQPMTQKQNKLLKLYSLQTNFEKEKDHCKKSWWSENRIKIQKITTFKPCHGRLPLRKYINMWPKASKSSLLLCSETKFKYY